MSHGPAPAGIRLAGVAAVKRPVGSILLGLFLLSQVILQGGRLWPALPVLGTGAAAPAWTPIVPTRTRAVLALPTSYILQGSNGTFWHLTLGEAPGVSPVSTSAVPQILPGGVAVRVRVARLAGALRILGVDGAPAWPSPDGRAVAVYDRADGALWAMLATDVRPRPLGSADPSHPGTLVWSTQGDRLAYLAGSPGHVWAWRVGTYASELGTAHGLPVAVRSDGSLVLAGGGGDPTVFLPGVGASVPVAAGRVLSASPYGHEALLDHAGHVYLTDLDTGDAVALPLTPALVGETVWQSGGAVVVARRSGTRDRVLLASLAPGRARWLVFPRGTSLSPGGLVALRDNRLVCVLSGAQGSEVTYVRNLTGNLA